MSEHAYLGEFSKQVEHTSAEWALRIVERYGQIDGAYHKAWVLDQVARVLCGASVTVTEARWADHAPEERFTVGTCEAYESWVRALRAGEDGPDSYDYDVGIAP